MLQLMYHNLGARRFFFHMALVISDHVFTVLLVFWALEIITLKVALSGSFKYCPFIESYSHLAFLKSRLLQYPIASHILWIRICQQARTGLYLYSLLDFCSGWNGKETRLQIAKITL